MKLREAEIPDALDRMDGALDELYKSLPWGEDGQDRIRGYVLSALILIGKATRESRGGD